MLKILQVTPFFLPSVAYGGIPVVSGELSLELQEQGNSVTVFTTDVFDASSTYRPEKEEPPLNRLKIYRFPNRSNSLAYNLQCYSPCGMDKAVSEMIETFDIVHLHGHRHILNNIIRKYAIKHKIPYVLTGHGTIPIIERRFLLKKVFDIFFGKKVINDASGFIAVSEFEKKQMIAEGIGEDHIKVIWNGIRNDKFIDLPQKGEFKSHFGIDGDYILYLGKITPRKGIEHLIRAFNKLEQQKLRLVIAGNDMGYQSFLKGVVVGCGLEEKVIFTGLLDRKSAIQAYCDALVTVYPSTLEIFGLVPFESIMCGTPVIVTDDCGCGEIISAEDCGFTVPYGDSYALSEMLSFVISNPEEGEKKIEKGQRFIKEKLCWKNIAAQTVDFYREVMSI